MPRSTLILIGENSMFHAPKSTEEAKKIRNDFGWIGQDYRQSVINPNLEDAIPKDEDFLPFMFRHITATIVGGGTWKATDFSKSGVLKKATPLFENKPVFINHEWEISNIVGGVGKTKYTKEFKTESGEIIPAGIDAPIYVDGKLHPDLCRKLQAFPVPHIQSVSVSVVFEWEPSHEFQDSNGNTDSWYFENRIGQMVDGEMVRRIVTKVVEAYETSLVWLGADPFAKILNDKGEPLNVERSAVVGMSKFDKDPLVEHYKKENKYFIFNNCFESDKQLNLVKNNVIKFKKSEKQNLNDMSLLKKIAAKLGKAESEVTEEMIEYYSIVKTEDYNSIKSNSESLASVNTKLATEKVKVEKFEKLLPFDKLNEAIGSITKLGITDMVEVLIPMAEFGQTTLKAKRELCLKHYKLAVGEENEDDSVIGIINAADDKQIEGLLKQYSAANADEFTGKCTECGSEKITFRTTNPEEKEDESDTGRNMQNAFR